MAVKHEIEIVISAEGTVRLTTRGLKGAECENETRSVERAVGRVLRRARTREYYEQKAGSTTTTHVQKK